MTQSARNIVAVIILLTLGVVGVVLYQLSYSDDRPVIIVSEGSVDIKADAPGGKTGRFNETTAKHWVHTGEANQAKTVRLTLKINGASAGCAINETAAVTGSIVLSYNLNGTAGTLTIFLSGGDLNLVSSAVDMVGVGSSPSYSGLSMLGDGPSGGSALTQVAFSLDNGNGGSETFACTPSSSKSLRVHIKQHKK